MKLIRKIILYILFVTSYYTQTTEDFRRQVDSLNDLSFSYRGSNPLETIKYGEQALELATRIDYALGQCMSYSFIGVGYRNMSYFKEALDNYLRGLIIADEIKDYRQLAFAYNNIGNLYLRSGNDSLAFVYLQKTLDLAKEKDFKVLLGYAYKNLGTLYFEKKDYDKSLEFLNISLSLREKLNDYWGMTNTLNEIGSVNREKGDYAEALNAYTEALKSVRNIEQNRILIGEIYLGKAHVYYAQKDFKRANIAISQSKNIFEGINARAELVEIYKLVSKINYATHNYKDAYIYLQKHDNLNDSIKVLNAERQLELMELVFTSDRNKKENELLKRENSIKLLQIEQEKQFRNLLLLISIILLVAAITSYLFYNGKKKSNKLLIKKNELIESQKAELSKINSTKDKFFSIIAHDLKNPFGSLINLSEFLLDEINDLSSEELQELAEAINKASKSSYRLLENLLLWSQTQKGHITYKPETFKIAGIIHDNFALYTEMAKEKNIQLKFEETGKDSFVFADKNMLDAIIRNLINNAIKYSYKDGTVSIKASMDDENTYFCVEDKGIGISEDKIDTLFSVEGKEIQSGTNGEKGTGLGLVVCKEFIDINGGNIKITSKVNSGTRICFNLPKK